jgi:hypothetical protein
VQFQNINLQCHTWQAKEQHSLALLSVHCCKGQGLAWLHEHPAAVHLTRALHQGLDKVAVTHRHSARAHNHVGALIECPADAAFQVASLLK